MAQTYNPFGKLIKFTGSVTNFASALNSDRIHSLIFALLTNANGLYLHKVKDGEWQVKTAAEKVVADILVSKFMVYADGHLINVADQAEFAELKQDLTALEEKLTLKIVDLSTRLDGEIERLDDRITDLSTNVDERIDALDGTATIATNANGIVTIKSVVEENGIIKDGSDIVTLAKVATTGSAVDIDASYNGTSKTVQEVITDVDSRIDALEALPKYDTVVSSTAADTPEGVVLHPASGPDIIGELAASATTMHKIYLVRSSESTKTKDIYEEYVTVKSGKTYSWEKIGNTTTDLKGYVKTVTVNGKQIPVDSSMSTNVTLGALISTAISNDAALSNTNFVNVAVADTSVVDGKRTLEVTSSVRVQNVSTASADNKGLAEASDVKSYVDSKAAVAATEVTAAGTATGNDYIKLTETTGASGQAIYDVSVGTLTLADASNSLTDGLAMAKDVANVIKENELVVSEALNALDASVKALDASTHDHEERISTLEALDPVNTTVVAGSVSAAEATSKNDFIHVKEEIVSENDLQYTIDASLAADISVNAVVATGLATDKYVKDYVAQELAWTVIEGE